MMMMILCMSKWMFMNAMYDVMFHANECPNTHIRSHIHNLHSLRNVWSLFAAYFSASPLIFWCKFCIPLGTSFELLRLLFRWYFPRWLFSLCLIFRQYLALHSLRNDFWAENLHCAPLGTTFFVASVRLMLRSLRNNFLSFGNLRASWICEEDIFHYNRSETITRN